MNRFIALLTSLILLTGMLSGCVSAGGLLLDSQPPAKQDPQVPTKNTQVSTTVPVTEPTTPETENKNLRDLIDLPQDVQIMIVGEDTYNSDAYQEAIQNGVRTRTVYGEFDGVYVLFPSAFATMAPYVEMVSGLEFCYPTSNTLHVFTDDGVFTLAEAIENGVLTAEQLQEVYDNYNK